MARVVDAKGPQAAFVMPSRLGEIEAGNLWDRAVDENANPAARLWRRSTGLISL
jgi:hypothetical protein